MHSQYPYGPARERIGASIVDRFWNEHNFVVRRDDGLFYQGQGAIPSWAGFRLTTTGAR